MAETICEYAQRGEEHPLGVGCDECGVSAYPITTADIRGHILETQRLDYLQARLDDGRAIEVTLPDGRLVTVDFQWRIARGECDTRHAILMPLPPLREIVDIAMYGAVAALIQLADGDTK